MKWFRRSRRQPLLCITLLPAATSITGSGPLEKMFKEREEGLGRGGVRVLEISTYVGAERVEWMPGTLFGLALLVLVHI